MLNKEICKQCNIAFSKTHAIDTGIPPSIFQFEQGWTDTDNERWETWEQIWCPGAASVQDEHIISIKTIPTFCKYKVEQLVLTELYKG